jgi:hypothetical protein
MTNAKLGISMIALVALIVVLGLIWLREPVAINNVAMWLILGAVLTALLTTMVFLVLRLFVRTNQEPMSIPRLFLGIWGIAVAALLVVINTVFPLVLERVFGVPFPGSLIMSIAISVSLVGPLSLLWLQARNR